MIGATDDDVDLSTVRRHFRAIRVPRYGIYSSGVTANPVPHLELGDEVSSRGMGLHDGKIPNI
jgi:hypothetical protein